MKAYPDSKCQWGYICLCDDCAQVVQGDHINLDHPIVNPPALHKRQECEGCGMIHHLLNPNEDCFKITVKSNRKFMIMEKGRKPCPINCLDPSDLKITLEN